MVSREQIEALAQIDEISDRLEAASRLADGNIVEIGGGNGVNTIRFLRTAREKKTTVVVVDPFEQIAGAPESYFKPYTVEQFYESIASKSEYLADHLQLINLASQNQEVYRRLTAFMPIGFIFIDGLQDRDSVYSDLKLAGLLGVDIICVDDFDRLTAISEVPIAVEKFRATTKYKFVDIGKREVYFIK